ncbi:mitochondrial mRNA pseudouridine synthase Trub2-like [Asterias rubens]|uniref:mitochondrial mRNA pseudouridine synthase Trub2-like n=1 Tax=Asterias rubens TaxID=7604 RepID=UPI00145565A7|nr:mitochondrial mRNA pseudouridine synthase Trub2-like [Asterias rubens]
MNNQLVRPTAQLASRAWNNLNGLFAVYKPSGMPVKYVKETIQTSLIEDLNKLEQRPQKQLVKVVQDVARLEDTPNALMAVEVPSFADHPLVRGPLFSRIKVAVVSVGVDTKMSGVMVLSVKDGSKKIESYLGARMPKVYTVKGRFGIATDSHDAEGKIWQKTSFKHVTCEKFDRVISNLERKHQKVLFSNAGVDLESQEAYELAVRGLLRPFGEDLPPLILNIRCIHFEPPDFELEIECIHETAQYLRKIVHDLAQDMKTSAVATLVRRTQDGPLTLDEALLRKQWSLPYIDEGLRTCRPLLKKKMFSVRRKVEGILEETR